MRLDHFLPFPAKPAKGKREPRRRRTYQWLRSLLPRRWTTQTAPRRIGIIRRWLRRIGPTWQSAPLRRFIQGGSFVLFTVLFFYLCWPYRAHPPQHHQGWIPADVDLLTQNIQLINDGAIPSELRTADSFHLYDQSQTEPQYLGTFAIDQLAEDAITISPVTPLDSETLETLSFSLGPWELSPYAPGDWPSHYADTFAAEDQVPAELFLLIDPLLSLSTAIANRSWVWSLSAGCLILALCVYIPRGFCGYLCPLGTLIDLFDWAIGRRVKRLRVPATGWWVHIKYYLLIAVFIAACMGVLISGFVAAIPVITRGFLFTLAPLQDGWIRGWYQVPPMNSGQLLSILLFLLVLGLGLLRPRFWCQYVCPSGAVFSLGNLFRLSERKVESSCIHCNQCVEICPFDAIKPDFTTRTTDCTLCQTCGGVCPTHAIKFVGRWDITRLKTANDPPTGDTKMGRRGFLASAVGCSVGAIGGISGAMGIQSSHSATSPKTAPVRPPGSVPEADFLQLCIRCGECFKVCPNNVLQPEGFQQGWEGLWAPEVKADWAGCEPSCNSCGQVCPTGAIRALPLDEKRHARMGLAILNDSLCLPLVGSEACQLCVDECTAAGYDAIEFIRVHTKADADGNPIPGSGFLAPQVKAESCVGCGLCQTRCYSVNSKDKRLLPESAIIVETGLDREDRIRSGSYIALSQQRAQSESTPAENHDASGTGSYLPGFLDSPDPPHTDSL